MKKFLSFLLIICTVITFAFTLVACGEEKGGDGTGEGAGEESSAVMTRQELSVVYKEIAVGVWEKVGIDDPTIEAEAQNASLLRAKIIDKKAEVPDEQKLKNIKGNAGSMASVIYLLSELYANENFVTVEQTAKFKATASIMEQTFNYDFTIKAQIENNNDKLYLELITKTSNQSGQPMGEQYSNLVIDYDFDTKTVKGFRFSSANGDSFFVDMALTTDNKYTWYETMDKTDNFAVELFSAKTALENAAATIETIATPFNAEYQRYTAALEKIMINVGA